ncbi:MAG: hypothetical protein HY321_16745 [Armatimonadetes bacterium]|nr:hypothetical protein [Armatimonadota bacterium]
MGRKQDRNGQTHYTGPMGGVQVFVFPKTKKEKQEQPDARIVIAQREFKKDAGPAGSGEMFDGEGGGGEGYEPGAEG